jgi:hypothetical protein
MGDVEQRGIVNSDISQLWGGWYLKGQARDKKGLALKVLP